MVNTPIFDRATLLEMLTYARPAGSETETAFIARYILPLGATRDVFGNYHVTIGESPILWSCHTDTVHRAPGRQTVHVDIRTDIVGLSRKSRRISSCLGADDTAGVFLCWSLIRAGVPGHYIFHYGEECGGHGSGDLAHEDPTLVSSSQFAIALDRKGTSDVITHQFGRCASDVFARSLAAELNRTSGLHFAPSDQGVFTDTANYTAIIGECTNLSVGYAHAHSPRETLDIAFLETLLIALVCLDSSALVASRTPADESDWRLHDGGMRTFHTDTPRSSSIFSSISVSLFSDDCEYCGKPYFWEESDAESADVFCSTACELADDQSRADIRRGLYLRSDYQDVQDAFTDLARETDIRDAQADLISRMKRRP